MELPTLTPKLDFGEGPPGATGHTKGNGRHAALALLSERTGSTTQQTRVTDSAGVVAEARGTRRSLKPCGRRCTGPEQHRVVCLSSAWQT